MKVTELPVKAKHGRPSRLQAEIGMPSTQRGATLEPGGGGLSIVRALTVLELIADADEGISLSAIARSLAVNKQIAARILSALVESGYVYRDVSTDKYYLSYKLSNLGLR